MSAAGGDAPKRPPRSAANPKSSSSTKRGRPRVEPHDESATERRRTQIRLAQRAYRERKETTIASLERRVTQLQQTVEGMNQAFLDLNDEALASGATTFKPALADALRRTTEHFSELTRIASAGDGGDGEGGEAATLPARPAKRRRSGVDAEATARAAMPDPTAPLPAPEELQARLDDLQASPALMQPPDFDYTVPYGPGGLLEPLGDPYSPTPTTHGAPEPAWMTAFPADPPPPQPPPTLPNLPEEDPSAHPGQQTPAPEQQLAQQPQQPGSQPPLDVPRYTPMWMATIDPLPTLKLPRTYSHHEPTFWRRLQRESHERVLTLLTDPRAPPALWQAKMKYSLCFGNARTIADAVRFILAKPPSDGPMGNWEWPFMHVGGSGLHFGPPAGESAAPPAGWRAERNIGPWCPTHMSVHTPVPIADFPWNVPRITGMDADFFDCHDVEMYLRTKGLFLTATSSVAEMEVDDAAPAASAAEAGAMAQPPLSASDSGSLESTSSPDTPPVPVAEGAGGVDAFSVSCDLDGYTAAPASAPPDLAFSAAEAAPKDGTAACTWTGLPMPALAPASLGPPPPPSVPSTSTARSRRRVRIDVDRLLDLLNCMAVCLGRSPGYRREDVDSALELVVQEARE